jgi:hypothetical protein
MKKSIIKFTISTLVLVFANTASAQSLLEFKGKISELKKGDEESTIIAKLGDPVFKEFTDDVSIYSYCAGVNPALFVKAIFRNGKMVGLLQSSRPLDGGYCSDAFPSMHFKF